LPTKSEVRYVEVWDYIEPSMDNVDNSGATPAASKPYFEKRFKDNFDNLDSWTIYEFETSYDDSITSNFNKD